MDRRQVLMAAAGAACSGCAAPFVAPSREQAVLDVTAAERAFAATMAARDHAAFLSFVAEDAVFLNGGKALRGKAAIGEHWKRFYAAPTAPFAWQPEFVEVLASGRLGQTTGPVTAPDGKVISRFNSTWRLDDDRRWRVVLDEGCTVCLPCAPAS